MSVRYDYTEEELIKMYIKLSKKLKKEHGALMSDIDKYAKLYKIPSSKYFQYRFGFLKNLKEKAGFKEMRREKNKFSEKELIQIYIEFSKKIGKEEEGASKEDFFYCLKEYDVPAYISYMKVFKSIKILKKKAGYLGDKLVITEFQNTEEGLKFAIKEFYKKYNRYPSAIDFQYRNALLPKHKILEKYGSMQNMYDELGIDHFVFKYEYLQSKSRKEILSDIAKIIKKYKVNSWKDFSLLKLTPSSSSYTRALKTNGAAIYNEAMGIEVIKEFSEKEMIEEYIKASNELNSKNGATAEEFIKYTKKNNITRYWRYQKIFGNIENLREKAGFIIDYDDDYFRKKTEEFVSKYERYPIISDCHKDVKFIRNNIIIKKYGSLRSMYKVLGINLFESKKLALQKDDELVFKEISEIIIKNNIKTVDDFKKIKLKASPQAYMYRLNMNWLELHNKVTLENKKLKYTKEEMIMRYERLKKITQKPIPNLNDFKTNNISIHQFWNLWGSYSNFIKEYEGVDISVVSYELTDEELINMYIDFSDYMDNTEGASSTELTKGAKEYGIPSVNYYRMRFTSIPNLKFRAGYTSIAPDFKYSREYIVDRLYKTYKKYKRTITKPEMRKERGLPGYSTITQYLHMMSMKKIWKIVLSERENKNTELEVDYNIVEEKLTNGLNLIIFPTKEDAIKKYESIKKKLNKSILDVNDLKKFNISTKSFTKFWDFYVDFIEEYEQINVRTKSIYYTEEELVKRYIDFSNYLGKKEGASDVDFKKYAVEFGIPSRDHYNRKFITLFNLKIKAGYKPIRHNKQQFTREQIIELMYKAYKKHKKKLNRVEIKKEKALPSYVTIGRYLNETSIKKIWEIVLSEKEK